MKPKESVGLEIGRTNSLLRSCFLSICAIEGIDWITGRNGVIIGYLYEHRKETIHQKDIEEHFSLRRSTASNVLSGLEEKGLIIRQSDTFDARHKKLNISQKGIDMYQSLTDHLKEKEYLIREGISAEELRVFFDVLKKIQNNIMDQTYLTKTQKEDEK